MKNFIFGIIAVLAFSITGFAQRMTEDQAKKIYSSQMVTLVNVCKTNYKPGMTYSGFLEAMLIPSPTFPSQDLLLKKVYGYLSAGTTDAEILRADNTIIQTFAADAQKQPQHTSTFEKALHQGEPKKWWQNLVNWVLNAGAQVGGVMIGVPPGTIPPIDLWPNNP